MEVKGCRRISQRFKLSTGVLNFWSESYVQEFDRPPSLPYFNRSSVKDVLEVPKESYDACSSDNPVGSLITTGAANISLTKAGDHFYICTVGRHCLAGQTLAITVSPTPGAPSPRSSTPRTTPSTTPAGEEGWAQTPEGSTSGATIQPSPPSSSSAGAGATPLLALFTITVVGWLI